MTTMSERFFYHQKKEAFLKSQSEMQQKAYIYTPIKLNMLHTIAGEIRDKRKMHENYRTLTSDTIVMLESNIYTQLNKNSPSHLMREQENKVRESEIREKIMNELLE